MRLSELDRRLIAHSELQGQLSIEALRKALGVKAHRARYSIKKLEDSAVISKPRPLVNLHALGLTCYTIYFSLAATNSQQKEALIERLVRARRVTWVAELGADFHYGVSIWANELSQVLSLLRRISTRYGQVFFQKSLNLRVSFTYLGRRYLAPTEYPSVRYRMTAADPLLSVDDTDRKILRALSNDDYSSHAEVSRKIQIPLASFERRKKQLEEKGLILGYFRRVYSPKLGMQLYKLLVYIGGFDPRLSKRIAEYLETCKSAVYFVECMGSWDFEIGVEVASPEEVVRISRELHDAFGKELSNIKILPVFGYRKFKRFPD